MKPVSRSLTVLRLIAVASLVLAVLFPSWAAVLQDVGGYYGGPGIGQPGGGQSAADAAAAIPTISYWVLGAISMLVVVIAALQRRRDDHELLPAARGRSPD